MELEYYKDISVPKFITRGIHEELPDLVIALLYSETYNFSNDIRRAGDEVDYLTVIKIESKRVNDRLCSYHYTMSQENTEVVKSDTKILPVDKLFNGRVWVIEAWNRNLTPKILGEHYVTMLLPSEY